MNFELGPAGEAAMRLVFTEVPQPALTKALIEIENRARRHFGSTLTDSVIGYTTLTLFFSASTLERDRTEVWLREQAEAIALVGHSAPEHSTNDVVLPVLYHPSVAPDLEWLADDRGLGIGYFITSIIAQIFLSFFASMIVMWFSRRREFRADEGGAALAGREKMIAALRRLQGDATEDLPGEFAAFGINGGRPTGLRALMMSHPPLEDRIAALERSR